MKKKLIPLILVILLCFSGCTKRFNIKDENGKPVKSYVSNILCKPETEEMLNIYIENEKEAGIDVSKLKSCEKFKANTGGYEGLWTSIFVKPLAWVVIKIGLLVKNYGLAIIITSFALRLILLPFSLQSAYMSEGMKKAKPELDKLEKKYAKKSQDKDAMMLKAQEQMMIYKKYKIKPLSGCLVALLQIPIFFAFLEAIYRIPVLFEGKFLVFNLGSTLSEGIKSGNYYYFILIALIIGTTFFSMKNANAMSMDDGQAKQMKTMNYIMVGMISITSFVLPTAIALYWIVSSGFVVIQNIIIKKINNNN